MLNEVIKYLDVKKDHWYIDCNLGGGGHTEGILKSGGKVLGIDLDPDAISEVAKNNNLKIETDNEHLFAKSKNLIIYQDNFLKINEIADKFIGEKVSGVLFDLGVSSFQLETAERGFSFNADAPLDMRMDKSASVVSATDLVNGLHEKELAELFWKLGEENFSKPIAKKIVEYRKTKLIETTNELAKIVLSARRRTPSDRTHPATRVFQALRIAVNDELNSLREALPKAIEVLSPSGRLAVISFHSLEDRIVKNYFRDWEKEGKVKILTDKPLEPTIEEAEENPRARSGKLRVIEKFA
jgi:16S rRNA (cytosine1402-N4)-methyltransferase